MARRMFPVNEWNKIKSDIEHLQGIEVSNITQLTKEQLDSLKAGDRVIKITGNQKHAYVVSYKGEGAGEGICLSYFNAGYTETVSYDRTEDGWEYNSTDIVPIVSEAEIDEKIATAITGAINATY